MLDLPNRRLRVQFLLSLIWLSLVEAAVAGFERAFSRAADVRKFRQAL